MRLQQDARLIFDHALSSVDSRPAVSQAVNQLNITSRPIYSIAIGKAAVSMARGLDDALGDRLTFGVITSPSLHLAPRWQNSIGGHPLPTETSLAAAQTAFQTAR